MIYLAHVSRWEPYDLHDLVNGYRGESVLYTQILHKSS